MIQFIWNMMICDMFDMQNENQHEIQPNTHMEDTRNAMINDMI